MQHIMRASLSSIVRRYFSVDLLSILVIYTFKHSDGKCIPSNPIMLMLHQLLNNFPLSSYSCNMKCSPAMYCNLCCQCAWIVLKKSLC
ncbi:unnamed protein product [Trifolium pratense]|uniref:Uncharacterized protein n=1 Tax=Trifolium pratense TaxID=57577 RepID=A0ACB0J8B3_TRIPR|nr:unnamed protein product [Trifolium pratense]